MNLVEFYDAYWRQTGDTFDLERLDLIAGRVGPGENLLEVDCGPGVLASRMHARGANVTGTDLSIVAVERAQSKGIPAQQVDVDTQPLPFADASFDTVVSNSMMEHRFFPERTLDECSRVLKPGGRLIVCLPNIGHWLCRWWILTGRFPYVKNSPTDMLHLRFFTVAEAKKLCHARGLEIEEVDGSSSLWAKEFYPALIRSRHVRRLYTWLAHHWPSWFARDFVLVCRRVATASRHSLGEVATAPRDPLGEVATASRHPVGEVATASRSVQNAGMPSRADTNDGGPTS